MKQTLTTLTPLLVVFTVLLSSHFIDAAWIAPSGQPSADNNAPAPINVSSENQLKLGDITALNLKAGSQMWSAEYCDENGLNCFDPATGSTSGSTGGNGWDYIVSQQHPGDGDTLTLNTGFSQQPVDVQIDAVNLVAEGGYNPGDVLHNIGGQANTNDRWHDNGVVIYSNTSGQVNVRISARGLLAIQKNPSSAVQQFKMSQTNWAFIVKANEGNGAIPLSGNVVSDNDNDGVPDADDNCPNTANTNQLDSDGDGIGNACDATPWGASSGGGWWGGGSGGDYGGGGGNGI